MKPKNKKPSHLSERDGETPYRPGIRAETLRAADIHFTDIPEPGSIEIPYSDLHGHPSGFCR